MTSKKHIETCREQGRRNAAKYRKQAGRYLPTNRAQMKTGEDFVRALTPDVDEFGRED